MVTIRQLDLLEDPDYIPYQVGGEDEEDERFLNLLESIAVACTGKRKENSETSAMYIRVTIQGNGIFVVHITGPIEGHEMNLKLMGAKESNYCLGVWCETVGVWEEVKGSPIHIEGSRELKFVGSYIESACSLKDIQIGFAPLKNALIQLNKGDRSIKYFLLVVVNIFEAARFFDIGYAVLTHRFLNMKVGDKFEFLIHSWGNSVSVSVRYYKLKRVWKQFKDFITRDSEGLEIDMTEDLNEHTVARKLRICKCKSVGSTEPWVIQQEKEAKVFKETRGSNKSNRGNYSRK